jgi:hypothetical protein
MKTPLLPGLLALLLGAGACLGQERKLLMPEQIEDDRPQGEVTVAFRVAQVGLLDDSIRFGQSPYAPISLEAAARLRDRRTKLSVVLVGKALTRVHELGINDPVKHFRGRTIEASGKVRYVTRSQITDGKENPGDTYTHYEMVIDDLDRFRVAPRVKETQELEFDKRILDGLQFGYLFPTFGDFDGDGKIDLLVGTKGDNDDGKGRLLVYLNRGTNKAPEYTKPFWFDEVNPSGRIPAG